MITIPPEQRTPEGLEQSRHQGSIPLTQGRFVFTTAVYSRIRMKDIFEKNKEEKTKDKEPAQLVGFLSLVRDRFELSTRVYRRHL